MGEGATKEDLLQMYPHLKDVDLNAVLEYAAHVIGDEDFIDQ